MLNKLNNYLDKKRKELLEGSIVKISLKVVANAPKNLWYEFLPTQPPTIKLKIKAVPENGKANRMIEKFVGKYFKAKVEIIAGETNSLKIIKIWK